MVTWIIATYNVENYFSTPARRSRSPTPTTTALGLRPRRTARVACQRVRVAEDAIPNAWDPVTNAPTSYGPGLVNAPRGAWRQEDLDRQTDKIVTAINGLERRHRVASGARQPQQAPDGRHQRPPRPRPGQGGQRLRHADRVAGRGDRLPGRRAERRRRRRHVGLRRVAGGVHGRHRGARRCAARSQANGTPVPGPAATAGTCSWASGQDVIRSGFIYKRATVVPVGPSDLDLPNSSAPVPSPFDNAREPLAQFFKPVGHPNSDGFAVIANHFKSKGDSDPDATGGNANSPLVGAFNLARTSQAKELLRFANEFAAQVGHRQGLPGR